MRIVARDPAGAHIALRMVGDGPSKPGLVARARAMKLDNVHFEDPIPKPQVPARLAEADAFVICVRKLPELYRFGISMNKIFDYMAAGRPTIIGAEAANNPIAETGAGLSVPPENPQALAAAILELAALPTGRRATMGEAGRRYVEANHSMELLAGRFAAVLDACLDAA